MLSVTRLPIGRKGAVPEVWLTAPSWIGKVARFDVERTPCGRTLCPQPGAAKPGRC
jgi:hypothetical protein